jgi:hypothetical protein
MSITDALTRVLRPETTAYTRCLETASRRDEEPAATGR